jgi:hypothetical protein
MDTQELELLIEQEAPELLKAMLELAKGASIQKGDKPIYRDKPDFRALKFLFDIYFGRDLTLRQAELEELAILDLPDNGRLAIPVEEELEDGEDDEAEAASGTPEGAAEDVHDHPGGHRGVRGKRGRREDVRPPDRVPEVPEVARVRGRGVSPNGGAATNSRRPVGHGPGDLPAVPRPRARGPT